MVKNIGGRIQKKSWGFSCDINGTVTQVPIGNTYTDPCSFLQGFFWSTNPSVSISASPSFGLREFGNDVSSPVLNATTTLWANPTSNLNQIIWRRGATILLDTTPTNPSWWSESYTDTGHTVSVNTTYSVEVVDGETRSGSASGSYSFVYPFYRGIASSGDIFDGITRTQITTLAGMNVYIQSQGNKSFTSSPTAQRYVFGYPASYGALTSIIDNNGFETISDYDVFTYNVVGLDTTSQSYRFYILKGDTTTTSFTNTYIF